MKAEGTPLTLIGVDMGGSHITVALSAPHQDIIWRREVGLKFSSDQPDQNLAHLFEILDRAVDQVQVAAPAILAVGVPGTVDPDQGIVWQAPCLGWQNLSLKTLLEERYHHPVLTDNDVSLASLGEARWGAGRTAKSFVCIMIGTNIGGGVIINGELYRGRNGAAGEIGWMIPNPSFLQQTYTGFGCLEDYVGGRGIVHQVQKLLRQHDDQNNPILKAVNGDLDAIRAEHVFEAALNLNDEIAQAVLDQAIDYLAIAVANVISLLDPELIVFGGGVVHSGDFLIKAIGQRIKGVVMHHPPLVLSTLGKDAVLYGALSQAQKYLVEG